MKGLIIIISLTLLLNVNLLNICQDGNVCRDSETCCEVIDGSFGCCDYQNAVCCSDKIHCCPGNKKCDVDRMKCVNADNSFSLFSYAEFQPIRVQQKVTGTTQDKSTNDLVALTKGLVQGLDLKDTLALQNCEGEFNKILETGIQLLSNVVEKNIIQETKNLSEILGLASTLMEKCPESPKKIAELERLLEPFLYEPGKSILKIISNGIGFSTGVNFFKFRSNLKDKKLFEAGSILAKIVKNLFDGVAQKAPEQSLAFLSWEEDLNIQGYSVSVIKCVKSIGPVFKDIFYMIKYAVTKDTDKANEYLAKFFEDLDTLKKDCYN